MATHKVEKKIGMQFQPSAQCENDACDFYQRANANTRNRAKRHVRDTGHRVLVITEKREVYGPMP